jgi:hypothetical protein
VEGFLVYSVLLPVVCVAMLGTVLAMLAVVVIPWRNRRSRVDRLGRTSLRRGAVPLLMAGE